MPSFRWLREDSQRLFRLLGRTANQRPRSPGIMRSMVLRSVMCGSGVAHFDLPDHRLSGQPDPKAGGERKRQDRRGRESCQRLQIGPHNPIDPTDFA